MPFPNTQLTLTPPDKFCDVPHYHGRGYTLDGGVVEDPGLHGAFARNCSFGPASFRRLLKTDSVTPSNWFARAPDLVGKK